MINTMKSEFVRSSNVGGWCSDTLLNVTKGHWLVEPDNNWIGYNFCLEEKFFSVGDVVFLINVSQEKLESTVSRLINKGASGFITEHEIKNDIDQPVLLVSSITTTLEVMASFHRNQMKAKVIAITGSVGKSTTRDILYHLLSTKYRVYRTLANYNLYTGVQLSIINTPLTCDYVIYEMAIGRTGSISKSSLLAKPDSVVITEVTEAHLQSHLSLSKIVTEKLHILDGLKENGQTSYRAGSSSSGLIELELNSRMLKNISSYGGENPDIFLESVTPLISSQYLKFRFGSNDFNCILNLPGKHNAFNALGALLAIARLGVDIGQCLQGLSKVQPLPSRMEYTSIDLLSGFCTLIDDSFNANPLSMRAAIEHLESIKKEAGKDKKVILVCSDMLELGSQSVQAHKDLGLQISNSKLDFVALTGSLSLITYRAIGDRKNTVYEKNVDDLIKTIQKYLLAGDIVLVKGSHATGLYRLSKALKSGRFSLPVVDKPIERFPINKVMGTCINPTGGAVFDFKKNKYYSTISVDKVIYPASLSNLFGLCYLFQIINENMELLNESVQISRRAESVASKWILKCGDEISVSDLLCASAICSSNEAMIALAEWSSGSESQFALDVTRYTRKLGLKKSIFRNATGLFNEGHVSSIYDIAFIVQRIKSKFPELSKIFSMKCFYFRGKEYDNTNSLLGQYFIDGFKTGRTPKSGFNIALTSNKINEERIAVLVGCPSKKDRNKLALELMQIEPEKFQPIEGMSFNSDSEDKTFTIEKKYGEVSLSILGDTYFGEYYDAERLSRNKTSFIERYGYQHSFKRVAKFLAGNDLNIANFEASLTHKETSEFLGKKSWILDADPAETIDILKSYRIDGVLLGNNHSYDFGVKELEYGLDKFSKAEIISIGAGRSIAEALQPMVIDLTIGRARRKVIIFSGYAFNEYENTNFECYATTESSGVANITSNDVLDKIKSYKRLYPSSYIVISPHWGANYQWASNSQRIWATKYVAAGADIVVGHGAHMAQEIEYVQGRPIIYSLGNFIFNSNGEYRKREVPPYSLMFQLKAKDVGGHIHINYDLLPIFCANHECGFQPYIQLDFKGIL